MNTKKDISPGDLKPAVFPGQVDDIGQFGITDKRPVSAVVGNIKPFAIFVIDTAMDFGYAAVRDDNIVGFVTAYGKRLSRSIDDILLPVELGNQGH